MRILNQTKNTALAQRAIVAETLFTRIKGLIGRKELSPGEAMVIKPCNSIHTLFMRFPIDVLFVDKDHKVIKAIPALAPFRVAPICFGSVLAVELPTGTITSTSTAPGDSLLFN
jgi:hypothetical protein